MGIVGGVGCQLEKTRLKLPDLRIRVGGMASASVGYLFEEPVSIALQQLQCVCWVGKPGKSHVGKVNLPFRFLASSLDCWTLFM
jgi:hypothetical protein